MQPRIELLEMLAPALDVLRAHEAGHHLRAGLTHSEASCPEMYECGSNATRMPVEANLPTTSPSASTSASAHTRRPPARTTFASARSRSTFFAFTGRMKRAKMSIVVIALF